MIASRNVDRLKKSANELRLQLPKDGSAEIDFVECNIRKEDQVLFWFKYLLSR